MQANFRVVTDVLLVGQGPGKSHEGTLGTRRCKEEDGHTGVVTAYASSCLLFMTPAEGSLSQVDR